jgi:hypothetical protein
MQPGQTAQQAHDEAMLGPTKKLASRAEFECALGVSGRASLSGTSPPRTSLLEEVMERHELTEADAFEVLEALGA